MKLTPWKVRMVDAGGAGLDFYMLERRVIDVETGYQQRYQTMALPARKRKNKKYAIEAAAKLNAVLEETA